MEVESGGSSSSMSQRDAVLVLSTAAYDAESHVLFSQRSGYMYATMREFLAVHLRSDLAFYDDERINSFLATPTETGLRRLISAARMPQPTRVDITPAFQIPPKEEAVYNARLVTRRYVLAFAYVMEQFALYAPTPVYNWLANVAMNTLLNTSFARASVDEEPAFELRRWVDAMRTFRHAISSVSEVAALCAKIDALAERADSEALDSLNREWDIERDCHPSVVRLMPKIAPLINAVSSGADDDNRRGALLAPFLIAMSQFVARIDAIGATTTTTTNTTPNRPILAISVAPQPLSIETLIDALAYSGLLGVIRDQTPVTLSSIHRELASGGEATATTIHRLRFIAMLDTIYQLTRCVYREEERVFVFRTCEPRFHAKFSHWTPRGDSKDLIYYVVLSFVADVVGTMIENDALTLDIDQFRVALRALETATVKARYASSPHDTAIFDTDVVRQPAVNMKSTTTTTVTKPGLRETIVIPKANTVPAPTPTPVPTQPVPSAVVPVVPVVLPQPSVPQEQPQKPARLPPPRTQPTVTTTRPPGRSEREEELYAFLRRHRYKYRLLVPIDDDDEKNRVSIDHLDYRVFLDTVYNGDERWHTDHNIKVAAQILLRNSAHIVFVPGSVMLGFYAKGTPLPELAFSEQMVVVIPVINGYVETDSNHWGTLVIHGANAYYVDSMRGTGNQQEANAYLRRIRASPMSPEKFRQRTTLTRVKVPPQQEGWECGHYVVAFIRWLHALTSKEGFELSQLHGQLTSGALEYAEEIFSIAAFKRNARVILDYINQRAIQHTNAEFEQPRPQEPPSFRPPQPRRQQKNDDVIEMIRDDDDDDASSSSSSSSTSDDEESSSSEEDNAGEKRRSLPPPRATAPVVQPLTTTPTERTREYYRRNGIDLVVADDDAAYTAYTSAMMSTAADVRQMLDEHLREDRGAILYDVFARWYRGGATVERETFLLQVRAVGLVWSMRTRGLELSDDLFLHAMKKKGTLDSILRFLKRDDHNRSGAYRLMASCVTEYGEWPFYVMMTTQSSLSVLRWAGFMKISLQDELLATKAQKLVCDVLAPGTMRYLVKVRHASEYLADSAKYRNPSEPTPMAYMKSVARDEQDRAKQNTYTAEDACRFFDTYEKGYLVGNGTYGVAVLYRFESGSAAELIVKYVVNNDDAVSSTSEATIERDAMLTLASLWRGSVQHFNHHIEVFDYAKCRFNFKANVLDRLLSNRSSKEYVKLMGDVEARRKEPRMISSGGGGDPMVRIVDETGLLNVDMIVMEYAKNGTLGHLIRCNHHQFNEPFNMALFIHCVLQVAGPLGVLYTRAKFTHNDLEVRNVFIQTMSAPPNITHVAYSVSEGLTFIMPYMGFLCKVGDLGKATFTSRRDPRFDVENLLLSYLGEVIRLYTRLAYAKKSPSLSPHAYLLANGGELVAFVHSMLRSDAELLEDTMLELTRNRLTELKKRAEEGEISKEVERATEDLRVREAVVEAYRVMRGMLAHLVAKRTTPYLEPQRIATLIVHGVMPRDASRSDIDVLARCIDFVYQKNYVWREATQFPMPAYTRLFDAIRRVMPAIVFDDRYRTTNAIFDTNIYYMTNYHQ